MIGWFFNSIGKAIKYSFYIMYYGLQVVLMIWTDIITIPLYLIVLLFCLIFRMQIPYLRRWKLILYPSFEKPIKKQMTGLEFEEYCAEYLRRDGYRNVVVTPGSNDYGADIVAEKNGERWVFQCKLYTGNVPNDAVQEVNAAKKHYNATRGAVMTNSKLTENARQLAWDNAIEIMEGLG